jgi:hypothetical protein
MPADVPDNPPSSAPHELQALWPWVRRFAYSDDVERDQALQQADATTLTELVTTIDKPAFDAINRYLDETDNAEEATPFGDLAQAAMEAALEIKSRGQ